MSSGVGERPWPERTLGGCLAAAAHAHGDRVFARFRDRTLTYGELDAAANRVANGLAALGLRHGDKVAVLLPNSPEFLFTMFGTARGGFVEVPLNTAQKGALLQYLVADSDAAVLVVDRRWLDRVAAIAAGLPQVRVLLVTGLAPGEAVPDTGIPALPFERLLAAPATDPDVLVRHTDLQAIMYTSGTSGVSKGVTITHCHTVSFGYDWLDCTAFTAADRLYTPLPLFHALAHTLGVVPVLLAGAEVAIVERFSASRYWDDARHFGSTVVHGIFGMVPMLLNQPPRPDDRDHSVRCFYIGPSSANPAFRERFGVAVVEVYGATETGIVTCLPYGEYVPGSCGKANPRSFEVQIVDDDDNPVATGELGEIVLRPKAPYLMTNGYYGKPEATAEAFRNFWFHTGDAGRMDAEGHVFFVDRKKDAIRRHGENVSSYEVERVVNAHPAVLESAAIAVPSELSEDEIKICVVCRPGETLHPAELIRFCDDRMAYFMVPRYVEVLDALPKTPNEKVRKVELRQMGSNGITAATWDRVAAGVEVTR